MRSKKSRGMLRATFPTFRIQQPLFDKHASEGDRRPPPAISLSRITLLFFFRVITGWWNTEANVINPWLFPEVAARRAKLQSYWLASRVSAREPAIIT